MEVNQTITCHPEAAFWPKDLREYLSLECYVTVFNEDPRGDRDTELKIEISREILRPTSGLRMTSS